MKLIFLGTGTSTGVPQMRCKCAVCTSTDPRDKRLRCSALLQTEPGAPYLLIDCGPDFREQMLRHNCPDLAAALLTHSHYDHVGGIDDLRPYCPTAEDGHFPLYCQSNVAEDLRNRVPYCFAKHLYPGVPTFNIHIIKENEVFDVDIQGFKPVEVKALSVIHGKLPILGYRIGKFAYITDCSLMPEKTLEELKGLEVLVINALRHSPHPSHFKLLDALNVISISRPKKAYLTHIGHDMGLTAETEKILPPNVELAYDGLVVDITDTP